jgi:hypothetical protein
VGRALVGRIGILEGAGLLDDEDLLARDVDALQLERAQFVQARAAPAEVVERRHRAMLPPQRTAAARSRRAR